MENWKINNLMRLFRIKALVFLMILLFGGIGFVNITIPLTLLLSIEFLLDLRKNSLTYLKRNIYGNRMLILMAVGGTTMLWTPDFSGSLVTYAVVALTIYNSYLLYYFITKYNLFNILVSSILVFSFINYSLALDIPLFKFLAYSKETVGGVSEGWGTGGRFSGITPNPNSLAIMLIFSIFLSLYVLDERYQFSKKFMYLHFANILLGMYTIFLTQSKKGLIFSLLIILLFLLLRFSIKKIAITSVISLCVIYLVTQLGFFTSIIEGSLNRFSNMFEALQGIESSHGNSTQVRLEYISAGLEGFYEKPVLGHGFDSFNYYNGGYSHNNLVELLFGMGIIGTVIFYTIHMSLFTKIIRYKLPKSLIALLIVIVLMDTGLVSYSYKGTMVMLLTCVILINEAVIRKRNKIEPNSYVYVEN